MQLYKITGGIILKQDTRLFLLQEDWNRSISRMKRSLPELADNDVVDISITGIGPLAIPLLPGDGSKFYG